MRLTQDPTPPTVLLRDAATHEWLLFERPVEVVETSDPAQILPCLRALEESVNARGLHAAGAVAYEAAPGLDPALATRPAAAGLPLLWFGLFPPPRRVALPDPAPPAPAHWQPSVTPDAYRAAFDRIRRHIHAGDAYQVNLTYRLRSEIGDQRSAVGKQTSLLPLFARLVAAQNAAYGACVATPRWALCSASPELFFSLDGTRLASRPMKGTAPRGLTLAEDRSHAAALRASEKNRAENLMIVDMVRNDLGRVAIPGSVTVPELFALEKYPTVWQLTSTVLAETHAPAAEIFAALFPAASITGAPKSSAMRIIAANEADPRGFYTGSVGFIAPGRRAQFNVAIRSLLIGGDGAAEFGTGGGVVWDSECALEQSECRTKARILGASAEPFSLLETMLWTPAEGVALLENHLSRLADSAEYFDVPVALDAVRTRLLALGDSLPQAPHRVRLLVARDGAATLETAPVDAAPPPRLPAAPLRVALAPRPVDRDDPFLYHKTTRRRVYEEALAACPGFDDALLWNAAGEITESTRANVVAELDGRRVTPPVRCGLLPGTLRQHLLDTGAIEERVLTRDDLRRATALFLVNSLRGWMPVEARL
jgi:para-aminobenzoate synthetase/4-amino-4-deoxychorismate lyase